MEEAKDAYDHWHAKLASYGVDHSDAPWHRMVKPYLGSVAGLRVLEIGCGRGGFSKELAARGAELTAADFSPAAVAIARQLLDGLPNVRTEVADVQALPYPDGTFDRVVSLETLEHVPDWRQGLRELVRVTKPGGKLVITTPNYFGITGLYRIYVRLTGRRYTELGQPINHPLLLHTRVRLLKTLKCDVNVIDGVGHYLPLPGHDPIRLPFLDRPRFLMKWFALHGLTIATKR